MGAPSNNTTGTKDITSGLIGAGGIMSLFGQANEGKAQSNYYNYLAGTATQNAALARASGQNEVATLGTEEFSQVKGLHTQERDVIGAQKAALASGGAGVGSKTGEAIVSDTENKVNLDEQALRYNADVKMKNARIGAETSALNYESQAAGYKMAGKNAAIANKYGQYSTMLSTAGQVATMWI